MLRLLDLQKQLILTHLGEGDVAVDFTMGNGYDTEFLCRTVGERGHVYAFDIAYFRAEEIVFLHGSDLTADGCGIFIGKCV